MKKLLKYSLYLGLFLLFVVITYTARTFLYHNLIDPVTRIVWLIIRLLRAIDQQVLWTLLIALFFIIILLTFSSQQDSELKSAYPKANKSEDRFTFWKRLIREADTDAENRQKLQKNLEKLHISINSLSYENDIEKFKINLLSRSTKIWQVSLQKVSLLFAKLPIKKTNFHDRELEKKLHQILELLESRMETQNDHATGKSKNS